MIKDTRDTIRQSQTAQGRTVGWWLAYGVVVLAMLTSAAFGALSLFSPSAFLTVVGVQTGQLGAGGDVFAAYTGARELAIAATLLVLLMLKSSRALGAVMFLTALANLFDAGHAVFVQRWVQAPGAFAFAIIYLATAVWFFNRSAGQAS